MKHGANMAKSGYRADNDPAPTTAYVIEQDIGDGQRVLGWFPTKEIARAALNRSDRGDNNDTINIRKITPDEGKFWVFVKREFNEAWADDENQEKYRFSVQIQGGPDSPFEMDRSEIGVFITDPDSKVSNDNIGEPLYVRPDYVAGKLSNDNFVNTNVLNSGFVGINPNYQPLDDNFNPELEDKEFLYSQDGARVKSLEGFYLETEGDQRISIGMRGAENALIVKPYENSEKVQVRVFTGYDYFGDHLEQLSVSFEEGEYDLQQLFNTGVAPSVDPISNELDGKKAVVFINHNKNVPFLRQAGSQSSFETVEYEGGDASGWYFLSSEDGSLPPAEQISSMIGEDGYDYVPQSLKKGSMALGSRLNTAKALAKPLWKIGNIQEYETDPLVDEDAWGMIDENFPFGTITKEDLVKSTEREGAGVQMLAKNIGLWTWGRPAERIEDVLKVGLPEEPRFANFDKRSQIKMALQHPVRSYEDDRKIDLKIGSEYPKTVLMNRNLKLKRGNQGKAVVPIVGFIKQNYTRKLDGREFSNEGVSFAFADRETARTVAAINRRNGINTRTIQVKPRNVWNLNGRSAMMKKNTSPVYINIAMKGVDPRVYARRN
jgi:hypothetical protein